MSNKEIVINLINKFNDSQVEQILSFIILSGFLSDYEMDHLNSKTLDDIKEIKEMLKNSEKYKGYTSIEEMFKEIVE